MSIAHLRSLRKQTAEMINYLSHQHEIADLNERGLEAEAQKLIEEGIRHA
jgi:ribosome recycling factor